MEMVVKAVNKKHTAGRFERLFEEKLVAYMLEKGIRLVTMFKCGNNDDEPEYELRYEIYTEATTKEQMNALIKEFGMDDYHSDGSKDVFMCSFVWSNEDADVLEEDCCKILDRLGMKGDKELHDSTYKYLKNGIVFGDLEVITVR